MTTLPPPNTLWRAFVEKNTAFDGTFIVAVKTTGVFCRPTCRAKPPKQKNIEFFASADEALCHGYRPCKLCRPLDASRTPEVVNRLTQLVDAQPQRIFRGNDLRTLGIDPTTARRLFRKHVGMTFATYQRSRRLSAALQGVRSGAPVVAAQVASGFESASGFREAIGRLFGAPPTDAATVNILSARWIDTPLGPMLAVANDDGLLLLDFHDRKGLPTAIARLRTRLGTRNNPAVIVPGPHPHLDLIERELRAYFAGELQRFTVPVASRGTPFEERAWQYLRTVPYGQTRTYGDQARAMSSPAAVRAVGRANGMNYVSIVIPCHRVQGANGQLTGYGGGLPRKRWLLDHEHKHA